jgi:hypothetical protein
MGGSAAEGPGAAEAIFDHEVDYRDPNGRDDEAPAAGGPVGARDATVARALAARGTASAQLSYSLEEPRWIVASPDTARSTGVVASTGVDFFAARTGKASRPGSAAVLIPTYEAELVA